jgi:hypothetical protein
MDDSGSDIAVLRGDAAMKRYAFGLAGLVALIAVVGDRWPVLWRQFLGEPPPWLATAVRKLTEAERWLASYVAYPTMFVLAVVVIAILLLWPRLLELVSGRQRAKQWFISRFNGDTAPDRAVLRQIAARNYEKVPSNDNLPLKLPDLVRRARLPASLPWRLPPACCCTRRDIWLRNLTTQRGNCTASYNGFTRRTALRATLLSMRRGAQSPNFGMK